MNSTLDATLQDVVEETFATLAFLMPVTDEERAFFAADDDDQGACDAPAGGERRLAARVDFSGPFAGCIVLSIDERMLAPLAANMLGTMGDSATSPDQEYDALRELSNVVCGNLLPRIATPRDVFKVHSPELLEDESDAETVDGRAPEARVTLWVDCGRADLALFTDHPITVPTA